MAKMVVNEFSARERRERRNPNARAFARFRSSGPIGDQDMRGGWKIGSKMETPEPQSVLGSSCGNPSASPGSSTCPADRSRGSTEVVTGTGIGSSGAVGELEQFGPWQGTLGAGRGYPESDFASE